MACRGASERIRIKHFLLWIGDPPELGPVGGSFLPGSEIISEPIFQAFFLIFVKSKHTNI